MITTHMFMEIDAGCVQVLPYTPLWKKFIMPPSVKLHSSVLRNLVGLVGSLAH
jgi:hypothetical protein